MKLCEKWKKEIVNKWLVYQKDGDEVKHFFLLTSLHKRIDWAGKLITNGSRYNAYHAMEINGGVHAFKYVRDLPADIECWSRCSYLNDKRLLKKLDKKVTKSLLRGEDREGDNPTLFKQVFGGVE
jgi:hypothetical protein